MSLIACPECKQSVSDQARTCPHCGFPLNKDLRIKLDLDDAPTPASPDELRQAVQSELIARGKIAAIKFFRERQPMSLADAKDYVESIERALPPGQRPAAGSGCLVLLLIIVLAGLALATFR